MLAEYVCVFVGIVHLRGGKNPFKGVLFLTQLWIPQQCLFS